MDLTEFDLTVLAMIYSTSFDRKSELGSVVKDYFEHCDVGRPITSQAIKRLASHALIEEQGSASRLAASGPFSYALNELGSTFLRFVSTDYGAVADASDVPGVQYAPDEQVRDIARAEVKQSMVAFGRAAAPSG